MYRGFEFTRFTSPNECDFRRACSIDSDYWPHLKWTRFENSLKALSVIFHSRSDSRK